uniref:Uncharacterized protein n=1 Tax=Aegilops tauschii subsp. strangulata TaxID=200361 RepID=A0A453SYR0_AEGTS
PGHRPVSLLLPKKKPLSLLPFSGVSATNRPAPPVCTHRPTRPPSIPLAIHAAAPVRAPNGRRHWLPTGAAPPPRATSCPTKWERERREAETAVVGMRSTAALMVGGPCRLELSVAMAALSPRIGWSWWLRSLKVRHCKL